MYPLNGTIEALLAVQATDMVIYSAVSYSFSLSLVVIKAYLSYEIVPSIKDRSLLQGIEVLNGYSKALLEPYFALFSIFVG